MTTQTQERLNLHIRPDIIGPHTISINPQGLSIYLQPYEDDPNKNHCLEQFDSLIAYPISTIVEEYPPAVWAQMIFKELSSVMRRKDLDPRIKEFLGNYKELIFEAFRKQVSYEGIPKTFIYNIQDINQKLPPPDIEPYDIKLIPLEEVCQRIGARIEQDQENEELIWFVFQYERTEIRIPLMDLVMHKGGTARLIGKLLFGASKELVLSEIPIKDWDIIAYTLERGKKFMQAVGEKDLSGIEVFDGNLSVIFYSRDIDLNQCLFAVRGFYYIEEAVEALETGKTKACVGDHGIYGIDYFPYLDRRIPKGRVVERALKPIAERKSINTLFYKENLQACMGIAPLIGAMRKIDKPGFPERLAKFYHLLEDIGQVDQYRYIFAKRFRLSCNDIFDFMENIHQMYPFVLFKKFGDDQGVAAWLVKKLINWFRYWLKRTYHLASIDMSWWELDSHRKELSFSLAGSGYQTNSQLIEKITLWLPGFIQRCEQRNEKLAYQHKVEKIRRLVNWVPVYIKLGHRIDEELYDLAA